MDKLEQEVPLEQALVGYRVALHQKEAELRNLQSTVKLLPPDDPERRLTTLYLERWQKLRTWLDRSADEDYETLIREIVELGNRMPGLATTRPPFSVRHVQEMAQRHRTAGFSDEVVDVIMEGATKPERGAPRHKRVIAIEALRMKMAKKFYSQIADALCDCGKNHKHQLRGNPHDPDKDLERQLSPCADRFRDLIKQLEDVLEKYSR